MKHTVRNWHKWASVVLAVPLILVGLTTVFIAHGKALGTREVRLPIGGLVREEPDDVRAQQMFDGVLWLGTRAGVYTQEPEQAEPRKRPDAPQDEIRGFARDGDQILLAGKMGLWRMPLHAGTVASEQIWKGDCWQISGQSGAFFAACKNAVLRSVDGRSFEKVPVNLAPLRHENTGVSLHKLIMDIHTGQLFFGKDAEWIWIDVLGLCMVGLGLTGLLMWVRSRRQRAAQLPASAPAPSAASGSTAARVTPAPQASA